MSKTRLAGWSCISLLLVMLSACGGGSGGSASNPSPPPTGNDPETPPEAVVGIAMPSSVSVVTATNTQ